MDFETCPECGETLTEEDVRQGNDFQGESRTETTCPACDWYDVN